MICRMKHYHIPEANPSPRRYIQLESCLISVVHSLYIALKHLRYPSGPRTLWTDALCINQDDLQERHEQVGQMRMVYSCACRVVVWLGEENQNSDAAMDFLADIDENVDLRTLERDSDFQCNRLCGQLYLRC